MAFEFFKGVRPLNRATALRDAIAGVQLASMNVPQLLGYARIAGMPAVTGLYTGFLPLIAFALFGASRHLVVAADSATATIFASKLSTMATPSSAEYVALAGMTALLTAVMLLIARVFKLGFLADFLSRTVLVGFLTGVGVQVGVAMLGDMLGITVNSRRTVLQIKQIVLQLPQIHWGTLAISALVVAAILVFKRLRPRWPVPLVAVIGGIVASALFDFQRHGVSVIGPVAGGLPHVAFPAVGWFQMIDLMQVAASCFVIIVAQSAATSRAFAEKYGERVDEDANLLGLAAANAAASMSGAFVVNGSLTQTAMADQAGARSQFAQVVFAGVVVIVLLFLSRWLQYLPHCVLAAIVFTIAVGLVHIGQLIDIRKESPGEFGLAVTTAIAVVVIGVENGILIAIGLSLLRHVRHSYRPHTMVLVPNEEGRWMPVPSHAGLQTDPGLIVFRFGADLFYANDHLFVDEVRRLVDGAPTPVRWFLVDAAAITDLDYSAGRSVNELCESLRERGVKVIFGRVNRYLRADMDRHGITPVVGAENIYNTLHEALAAVHPNLDAHAEA
ncbi:SulP family inorganic anion transporter [Paraburkholderia tropica]|uniref:High affinity sulphate transporter 1 n=2 Tax=Burkholderiaceae TaxID=119060 RepID=A0AAQ1JUP8_9BURK|nr:SulP family inorganic anion transporter [Paraburkholderia tropica]RQN36558.1 SulP family inorganic anion transporter [Paraburkholderia tropica]SEJ82939.1 high affinity sulphate transporter 1 [Paraburkholderia tropica]